MIFMPHFFVKSFEEDHATKTLVGTKKKTFQTLDNILMKGILRPNTKSFGQKRRLSTTVLSGRYTKTYRPQGLIFRTKDRPDYVIPFDLVLLSDAGKIVVHYYRIKDNLHVYYNHKLINGYQGFIFKSISLMEKKFVSPEGAWKAVNAFRVAHGYPALPPSKRRLAAYNEVVFQKPIKVVPVALFGYRAETRRLARKYGLRYFRSAGEFYKRIRGGASKGQEGRCFSFAGAGKGNRTPVISLES